MSSDNYDPEWDSIVTHNSKPPLRWIANWAGSIASKNMLELSYMEDEGLDKGFKYKYYGWLWDIFWPIYQKYGTFYTLQPYWQRTGMVDPDYDYEKYHWDFVDEETGDAFKVINFGN